MKTSPTYTALDLLETVIEFISMTSDKADWSFEKQKYGLHGLGRITRMGIATQQVTESHQLRVVRPVGSVKMRSGITSGACWITT